MPQSKGTSEMIQRVSDWWVMRLGLTRNGWRDWHLGGGEALDSE